MIRRRNYLELKSFMFSTIESIDNLKNRKARLERFRRSQRVDLFNDVTRLIAIRASNREELSQVQGDAKKPTLKV